MAKELRQYVPKQYWERLLRKSFNIKGVAYPDLPSSFNRLFYKAMENAVNRVLKVNGISKEELIKARLLDVGSGTGFWVDFWLRAGARDISGFDLTNVSVKILKEKYPSLRFYEIDIADVPSEFYGKFNLISVMSVLLHITDDKKFEQAIGNIKKLLKESGIAIIIDPLITNPWWGDPFGPEANSKVRSLKEWGSILQKNGLELKMVVPVTSLLANAVDTKTRWLLHFMWFYWGIISKLMRGREWVGIAIGLPVYLADMILIRIFRLGFSTKCFVVSHRDNTQ
jgi:SAM-dependent methyltransferase